MRLQAAQGDGAPLRTHLQRLRQSTGRVDPLLARSMEPLPPAVAALWDVFVVLSGTRGAGDGAGGGIAPITCAELQAWQALQRLELTPWEADTLLAMDRALRGAPTDRKDLTQ